MAHFLIEVDTKQLPDHTEAQLLEWAEYCIGQRGGISLDNPLNLDDFTGKITQWDNFD